jgi:REP element-mobilizing transposase RayT
MARPLRIELGGGRYHVTSRGNEQRNIFRGDRDRQHFIELLAAWPEQFGTRLHAHVLMNNHYHLMVETPEPNLSRAMQWLNGSYTTWFNVRHRRVGHLFQGRFKAYLVEDDAGWQEVGRYVHLNPVRVDALALGKSDRVTRRWGAGDPPSPELVAQRLEVLRQYRWSSYRAYAGLEPAPAWLFTEVLGALCGGRSTKERCKALQVYTEDVLREGLPPSPWEGVIGGLILGSEAFAQRIFEQARCDLREQPSAKQLRRLVTWDEIVSAVEAEKGEAWETFRDRYGDWGRDVALWLGRTVGRQRLAELARQAGGIHYAAVGGAVSRVRRRLQKDVRFAKLMDQLRGRLSNIEI